MVHQFMPNWQISRRALVNLGALLIIFSLQTNLIVSSLPIMSSKTSSLDSRQNSHNIFTAQNASERTVNEMQSTNVHLNVTNERKRVKETNRNEQKSIVDENETNKNRFSELNLDHLTTEMSLHNYERVNGQKSHEFSHENQNDETNAIDTSHSNDIHKDVIFSLRQISTDIMSSTLTAPVPVTETTITITNTNNATVFLDYLSKFSDVKNQNENSKRIKSTRRSVRSLDDLKRKKLLRNSTNLERIERSANLSSTKTTKRIQMLIKGRLLQILPDGIVNGTENDASDYSKLINKFSHFI